MDKRVKAYAESNGWQMSLTKSGHVRLLHPEHGLYFTCGTTSDRRSAQNAISDLRRAQRTPRPIRGEGAI